VSLIKTISIKWFNDNISNGNGGRGRDLYKGGKAKEEDTFFISHDSTLEIEY